MIEATFGHVNLVARDWRALAAFYQRVFDCVPVPPSATTAAQTSRPAQV
jgi:predicted enzyme related to lactoylglutathione lyase